MQRCLCPFREEGPIGRYRSVGDGSVVEGDFSAVNRECRCLILGRRPGWTAMGCAPSHQDAWPAGGFTNAEVVHAFHRRVWWTQRIWGALRAVRYKRERQTDSANGGFPGEDASQNCSSCPSTVVSSLAYPLKPVEESLKHCHQPLK